MIISTLSDWAEYKLVDSGDGQKLERFGKYLLIRPDPQIIWRKRQPALWNKADAIFIKQSEDQGRWQLNQKIPEKWPMAYQDLTFFAKLSPFKHTGIFPEQALQWQWAKDQINKANRPVNVLNLFAYTGAASLVCAKAGAKVTHVDSSRSTIGWAKENQAASNLDPQSIRWILDDVLKFVEREVRRGAKYDAIIMDPPVYGHGPTGEIWKFSESFPKLMKLVSQLISDQPLFVLINAYAISSSALMLENVLRDYPVFATGQLEVGELAIKEDSSDRQLSTGIFCRWSA